MKILKRIIYKPDGIFRSNLSKIMSMVSYVNDWWKVMEKTGPLDKDELEKIKWMISRIDLLHENMIGSLIASAKMFESYGEKTISKLKELRGILTAPFIGGIAILFGISESFPIDPALFTWVLIGLVVPVTTIFIIFTKLIGIFENLYANLDEVVNIQIVNLGKSQGFMTTSVADLTIVKYDFVYNYFIFSNLLVSAVMASLSNEFKKLAKQYKKFKDLKLRLEEYAKESGKDLEAVSKYFPLFDSSKFIPKDLLDFVDSSLAKYKPKN